MKIQHNVTKFNRNGSITPFWFCFSFGIGVEFFMFFMHLFICIGLKPDEMILIPLLLSKMPRKCFKKFGKFNFFRLLFFKQKFWQRNIVVWLRWLYDFQLSFLYVRDGSTFSQKNSIHHARNFINTPYMRIKT